jgi:DNA-binding XRE family transcriptional regulator
MGVLTARVKHAERMMTQAAAINQGIEITFADGCKGLIPFGEIPEIGKLSVISSIELANPYQVSIRGSKGELAELPWDFVRHYCDASYRSQVEATASEGMQVLGTRIRAIRQSIGMTQSELAVAAKIGRVTEVRIENGKQSPRYETLVAIAQALQRPLEELVV